MTEIIDEYDYDSSDEEDVINTVGNIPREWYNKEGHIGYDRSGRKILKPSSCNKGEIDSFLDNFDNKDRGRIVKDPNTGQDVILSDGDIMLIKNLCNNRSFIQSLDDDFVSDWFTRETMETPISAIPPQKSSFIPSLSDKKKVSLIVHAMKAGLIKKPTPIDKDCIVDRHNNDVYSEDLPDIYSADYGKWQLKHVPEQYLEWLPPNLLPNYQTNYHKNREIILPPKTLPEGNELSYRPAPEFLLNEKEQRVYTSRFWDKSYNPCKHLDEKPLIPRVYDNLRSVGFSKQLIIDMEKRTKDLTHATRIKKEKVNSSTEKMLEQTRPKEETFRPYPNIVEMSYDNNDVVLAISVSCCGNYFATVGYEMLNIWLMDPVELTRSYPLVNEDTDRSLRNPSVAWNPNNHLLAVTCGKTLKIINPNLNEVDDLDEHVRSWYKQSMNHDDDVDMDEEPSKKKIKESIVWQLIISEKQRRLQKQSSALLITLDDSILEMSWHVGGDYLHTISGKGKSTTSGGTLILHRLSKCVSKSPFAGNKHQWSMARFNTVKSVPLLYLAEANTSSIQVYHLHEKKLVKTLQCSGIPSVMTMHPSGDHLIVGTFEGKVCWFDLDMGINPFKTLHLKYNSIRSITVHDKYPLVSCSTANGSIIVLYAKVYTTLIDKPSIHVIELFEKLGKKNDMYSHVFHRTDAKLICGGADKVIRIIDSCH